MSHRINQYDASVVDLILKGLKLKTLIMLMLLTALSSHLHLADAQLYCISSGSCLEISGYKRVVTSVDEIGGLYNSLGACTLDDWPYFRDGTKGVTYVDITCEDQLLQTRWTVYCVDFLPQPSVGDVLFSNCPTCPTITSFTADNTTLDPIAGGKVKFNYQISGSYDSAEISMTDAKGVRYVLANPWDGRLMDVLDPGTYTAILTVRKAGCADAVSALVIKVERNKEDCKLNVTFGSSASVASGGLTHSQPLFSSKGEGLVTNLSLFYNSIDSGNSALGRGWTHNYDIAVTENTDGSVLVSEPSGSRRLYKPSGGGYTPPAGDYSTLAKNGDGTFTLTHKDGVVYNFNAAGNIASIIDRNGNTMTFAYTGGNLTTITDPSGRAATLAYDGNNRLTTITDPSGHAWLFTAGGDTLTGVTQPDGGAWSYTYDADGFMLTKTDPMNYTTTYAYDASHRVVGSIDPEGKSRSMAYPASGDTATTRSSTFTEKDGGVWTYTYNTSAGTLTQKTDPLGYTTTYTYDAAGNTTSEADPTGGVTGFTYDSRGNTTSVTNPLSQITTYTYNSFGQVTSVTDPLTHATLYEYDAKGNLISVTDPTGAKSLHEYDTRGNRTKSTDPLGRITVMGYDSRNNLISVRDAMGSTTTFTYDAAGNMTAMTDALGNVTTYTHDAMSRLTQVRTPEGQTITFAYDKNGNIISWTDPNGGTTTNQYDYRGQVTRTTDPQGFVTTHTYGGTGCGSCGGGG